MAVQNFGSGGGGFQLSPGINVSEIDLTTVVPAIDTTSGAIAGVFNWGPAGQRVLITSENQLAEVFGKPTNNNPETWFTSSSFLSYSNSLYVSRAIDETQYSAIASESSSVSASSSYTVLNDDDYLSKRSALNTGPNYVARCVGELGNSLKVSVCSSANQFNSVINLSNNTTYQTTSLSGTLTFALNGAIAAGFANGDVVTFSGTNWYQPAVFIVNANANGVITSINSYVSNGVFVGTAPANPTPTSIANTTVSKNVTSTANGITFGLAWSDITPNTSIFTEAFTLNVGESRGNITFTGNGSLETLGSAIFQVKNKLKVGDYIKVGNTRIGTQSLKIRSFGAISASNGATSNTGTMQVRFDQPLKLSTSISNTSIERSWEYFNQVDQAPGRSTYVDVNGNNALQVSDTSAQNDEVHVVIVDEDGKFTGSPGSILEVYEGLSRATDSKLSDGTTNYYKDVINNNSAYVWVGADQIGAESNTALNVQSSAIALPLSLNFAGSTDINENETDFGNIARAYDLFTSPDDVDISLIMTGKSRGGVASSQSANYLIDNLAEVRKDCVVFVSPPSTTVVNQTQPVEQILTFRTNLHSSSYAVVDSGYKYMYDKYNDIYRYIPLNGDIAGLCARTDKTRDPWFSPAGTTRGAIKNVIKLAFNPTLAQRDQLYKNGINPVVNLSGQGPILYGDKTLLAKPSAFDRINVRRLFIVLEKAISNASKALLFEFNDEFTRAQFRNLIEPYLRDVLGRRGIYDFKVVCDETNNTPQVIDSNRFVGDIYIKPARSINYIQLNFVAVRSGVEFSEITG
jgi:hypothetical protein